MPTKAPTDYTEWSLSDLKTLFVQLEQNIERLTAQLHDRIDSRPLAASHPFKKEYDQLLRVKNRRADVALAIAKEVTR